MEKIFKGGVGCPATGNAIDSPQCRNCKWFVRGDTWFIVCDRPHDERAGNVTKSKLQASKKTAIGAPVCHKQKTKGNSKQIKTDTTPKKRGRPRTRK